MSTSISRAVWLAAGVTTLSVAAVVGTSNQSSSVAPVTDLEFRPLLIAELEQQASGTGLSERVLLRSERTFETPESWAALWGVANSPALPAIDFAHRRVVGIFLGPSSSGHRVLIDRVSYSQSAGESVVHYTIVLPNPKRIYPTVIVYPSVVAEVDRRPGAVRFVQREAIGQD
jgi:hypothetical protein